MAPRRILVTGAAGFVGSHLLPALRGAFPDATLHATSAEQRGGLSRLDVTDVAAVDEVARTLRPDACIHLAGVTSVPAARRDPGTAWRVNLHGALTLAHALLAHAPDCRLLFVSSAEVYGRSFSAGAPLDEQALPAPSNTYAASKAAADLAIGALAGDGLRALRMRPFNHTGPGQSAGFVVASFARQAARIEAGLQPPVLRTGDLAPRRDFLDVRDVCAAYVAALLLPAWPEPGSILNLASGTARRIGDILDQVLAITGIAPAVETEAALLRPSDIAVACGDAARARALLGWEPSIAWETTLRDMVEAWRQRVRDDPAA